MIEFLAYPIVIISLSLIAPWIFNIVWIYWEWVDNKFDKKP